MSSAEIRDGGYSLLELLVAACCTTLLAGAVLPLLVGSAQAERHRARALEAELRVDSALQAISADLRAACTGLEGGRSVRRSGQNTPIVAPLPSGGIRILRPLGPVLEVGAALDANTYEVGTIGALGIGVEVVAVGQPGRPAGAPVPAGSVVSVFPAGEGALVHISWGAEVVAWGLPRALLPITWREYELRNYEDAYQLRRRDRGGSWQPVVENLSAVTARYLIDHDGDGIPDEVVGAGVVPAEGSRLLFVRLDARAEPAFGQEVAASTWVRVEPQ
jgi:hypothetical protein